MNRRHFFQAIAGLSVLAIVPFSATAIEELPEWGNLGIEERDKWMAEVLGQKSLDKPAVCSKFSDGMYYLREPLTWKPNDSGSHLSAVTVPAGFVTDLTSIPRPFWSLMPRDGSYADAAIVHDYLYWIQTGSRQNADDILKQAMMDLEVHPVVVEIIFRGVRSIFGTIAWNNNTNLRQAGESRQLSKYPSSSATSWSDWKKHEENLQKGG